ncbi:arthropod-associated lipoprotein [Borrelia hermsii]|uniref:Arthropod-associated lipoprotein n=2 Tax=Borrelia hermsii TaxID=140 RepID=G3C7W7_BORHE|nr:arthropod-associated lipoprotein [Borrelia hermsii]ADD14238.1 arthropod-associated lipoprotein [Borrelia hermsii]ADN26385.1 arthropod-associated lipoprotein [Borrelia hermsii]AMR75967.1 hypothetical protein A0V01_04970 [Borrelia hermsii]ANA43772.1 Arthropod-associated Lipoprotein [Borrelia hermsii HS1]UCP01997.1 hypothetical protein K9R62_05000 [Borrelia hermsii]
MKKIILGAIVALFALLSCDQNSKADPTKLGTGEGNAYVKVIKDPAKLTVVARNFEDIKALLPPASAGKTYQDSKLDAAFTATGTDLDKFSKALAAKQTLEAAKKNAGANVAEIDKELIEVIKALGFTDGDAAQAGSFNNVLKKFTDALEG